MGQGGLPIKSNLEVCIGRTKTSHTGVKRKGNANLNLHSKWTQILNSLMSVPKSQVNPYLKRRTYVHLYTCIYTRFIYVLRICTEV